MMSETTKPIFYLPILASLGGLLMGYDTGMIGSALLFIHSQIGLSNVVQGMFASIIIPGTMCGIAFATVLAKKIDRRELIAYAALISGLGLICITAASLAVLLMVGRFIFGIAIGIILVTIPLYLAEIAPARWRGGYVAVFQLCITLGSLLGYAASYWLAHYQTWRVMFASSLIIAFLQLCATFFLPASSYEAEAHSHYPWREFFAMKELHKPLCISIGLALLHQLTGINVISYFAPQIMQAVHHQANADAIFSGVIMMSGNFLFTILALFVFDRVGRRPVLLMSLFLQCIALVLMANVVNQLVMIGAILLFIFAFAVGLGPGMIIMAAEIFPLQVRSQAMGVAMMVNNIAAFIIILSFLPLLHWLGREAIFWIYAMISFMGLIFIWKMVPETKQLQLGKIKI